jgi:hypothetical protein
MVEPPVIKAAASVSNKIETGRLRIMVFAFNSRREFGTKCYKKPKRGVRPLQAGILPAHAPTSLRVCLTLTMCRLKLGPLADEERAMLQ